jgi:hypothetical protein
MGRGRSNTRAASVSHRETVAFHKQEALCSALKEAAVEGWLGIGQTRVKPQP